MNTTNRAQKLVESLLEVDVAEPESVYEFMAGGGDFETIRGSLSCANLSHMAELAEKKGNKNLAAFFKKESDGLWSGLTKHHHRRRHG